MSESTTSYPYNSVVYITDFIGGVEYQASGVLIAPNEVLTATHVVYQSGVGTATDIEVSPGYEDGATPYGTIAGVSFHYNGLNDSNDLISNASSQEDFAVIHLAEPVSNDGTMTVDPNYGGGVVNISGYPGQTGGTQDDVTEPVTVDPSYTLFEGRGLGAGSSGGPVWIAGASGQADVVGLVSSGSGNQGYFVQLTTSDYDQIEAWVAEDDGSAPVSPVSVADTVTGANGAIVTVPLPAATASLGNQLLEQLTADIAAGVVVAENAVAGAAQPSVPGTAVGELVIGSDGYYGVVLPYKAVIDTAAGASTVSLVAGSNDSVVAAGGPLVLVAGEASGTLAGGSGGTLFYGANDGGTWDIALGGGNNTIAAGAGTDTIASGSGANLVYLGSGLDQVDSTGADTIVGGTGVATVAASSNNALMFANGTALTFVAGSGASTVVSGSSSDVLIGGTGATLFFGGTGASTYLGGGAADTVVGGTGPMVGRGEGGNVLMYGGSGGGNVLNSGSGQATLVAGGNGDVLTASGRSNDLLVAASGAETLNASRSSGADVIFAGSGNDYIEGGTGPDQIAFVDGQAGGNDTINYFDSGSGIYANYPPDTLVLIGYGGNAAVANALGSAVTSGGSTTITLADNTSITFLGLSHLNAGNFLSV